MDYYLLQKSTQGFVVHKVALDYFPSSASVFPCQYYLTTLYTIIQLSTTDTVWVKYPQLTASIKRLSICLPIHPSVRRSVYIFNYHLPTHPPSLPATYPPTYLPTHLHTHLHIYLLIYLYNYLFSIDHSIN